MSKEPNERLQEVKNKIAKELGYKDFNEIKVIYTVDLIIKFMHEVCKRYAFECAKEAFEAGTNYQRGEHSEYHGGREHDYPDFDNWAKNNSLLQNYI